MEKYAIDILKTSMGIFGYKFQFIIIFHGFSITVAYQYQIIKENYIKRIIVNKTSLMWKSNMVSSILTDRQARRYCKMIGWKLERPASRRKKSLLERFSALR